MNRRFSLKNIRFILLVSILMECICLCVFGFTYFKLKRTSEEGMAKIAERFLEKIDTELSVNNIYMNQTVTLTSDYRKMFNVSDLELVNRISELQMIYNLLNNASETRYNFFVYDRNVNKYLELTMVKMDFSQYREIRPLIIEKALDRTTNGKWYLVDLNGKGIILSVWKYGNYLLGAWTEADDLLAGLNAIDWGQGGRVELVEGFLEDEEDKEFNSIGSSVLRYSLTENDTNFYIQITIARDKNMMQLMLLQGMLFLLAMGMIAILFLLILEVKVSLLVPAKKLTMILQKYRHYKEEPDDNIDLRASIDDAHEILE